MPRWTIRWRRHHPRHTGQLRPHPRLRQRRRRLETASSAFNQAINERTARSLPSSCSSSRTYKAGRGAIQTATEGTEWVGQGEVDIADSTNRKLAVPNVLHVPELNDDLLSVSKLCDQGLTGKVDAEKFTFQDSSGKTVLEAKRDDGLYRIQPPNTTQERSTGKTRAYSVEITTEQQQEDSDETPEIDTDEETLVPHDHSFSHGKFAHLAEGSIKDICKLAGAHPPMTMARCRACSQTKMTKRMPKTSQHTLSRSLELVHVDIAGKFGSPALDKSLYSLVIVDAYSSMCWVYGLRTRNEAPQVLRDWRAEAENRCGQRLGAIRTDNAPELVQLSSQWQKTDGVIQQLTVPYSSWQNGKAERFHRSLEEGTRALLKGSKLPTCFWLLAMETTCYVLNMKTCSSNTGKSRLETFCGTKPTIDHMHPWGCEAFTYLDSQSLPVQTRKDKMMDAARWAVFVGYCQDTTKIWRFWAPDIRRVITASIVDWYDETPAGIAGVDLNIPSDIPILFNTPPARRPVGRPRGAGGAGGAMEMIQDKQTEEAQSQAPAKDTTMLDPEDNSMVHPLIEEDPDTEIQPTPIEVAEEQTMENTPAEKDVDTELRPVPVTTTQTPEVPLMDTEEEVEGTVMSEETAQRLEELSSQKVGKRRMHEEPIKSTKVLKKARVMLAGIDQSRPKEHIPVPRTYRDAVNDPDWGEMWRESIKAELTALIANNTWEMVAHKEGMNLLTTKWVFQPKHHVDGSLRKLKSRLTVRGFTQKFGVDFTDTYAATASSTSLRLFMAMVGNLDLECDQIDVNNAFTESNLKEDIYLRVPEGLTEVPQGCVLKLRKSLYGLKQAAHDWYETISKYLVSLGFTCLDCDPCLFRHHERGIYILLYVDDMPCAARDRSQIEWFKTKMKERFGIKDLGPVEVILGVKVTRDRTNRRLWLSQEHYVNEIVQDIGFTSERNRTTTTPVASENGLLLPRQTEEPQADVHRYQHYVGCLQYLAQQTRPDIAYTVNKLCQHLVNPAVRHEKALHHLIRYLRSTKQYSICFGSDDTLIGYSDANFAAKEEKRASTLAYVFKIFGGCLSWKSQLQKSVSTSTTEAEYMALSQCAKESQHLTRLIQDMWDGVGLKSQWRGELTTTSSEVTADLRCDNEGAVALAQAKGGLGRVKHIDVHYHSLRDLTKRNKINVQHVGTADIVADGLTKSLAKIKHMGFITMLGMKSQGELWGSVESRAHQEVLEGSSKSQKSGDCGVNVGPGLGTHHGVQI
ncbi:Retrovirus-related Pol polyprotein from transposon TNT 1-94 [Ceratocystis fimbriata CBS 114723]|uniref:Retrovirus-related Pol polyprotein from transposon TNT 1-94 n=1 Tax=Ceratocystis fimbriata CBS 114723 TaxID=1035309 RepID=A0A2C5W0V4_9PEZI|nr:Retrovirus-related Pol polyprotein from transposon TNT 1-94 [Ceratocystis fimbriata CBS 114723]